MLAFIESMHRYFPSILFLLAGHGLSQTQVSEAEVARVQKSAILIDTHNDVTSATVAGLDIGKARTDGHTDIPRMRAGGMGAQFFAVYVGPEYARDKTAAHRALEMIDTVRHDIIERYPDTLDVYKRQEQSLPHVESRTAFRRSGGRLKTVRHL